MAVLQVNDVLEAKVGCHALNQAGINVRHYRVEAVTGSPTDQMVANALDTAFVAPYKAAMGTNATYYGVQVQKIRPIPAFDPVQATTNQGLGQSATATLPGQVSGLISLRTGLSGRAGRGRTYVPFPYVGAFNTVDGTPSTTYLAELDSIADQLVLPRVITVGGDSVTITPVLYDRGDHSTIPITGFVIPDKFATQRRRGGTGAANTFPPF